MVTGLWFGEVVGVGVGGVDRWGRRLTHGCGSKIRTQDGPLVNGNMD